MMTLTITKISLVEALIKLRRTKEFALLSSDFDSLSNSFHLRRSKIQGSRTFLPY